MQVAAMAMMVVNLTSCRLGEILSEADPDTQAEIEREESIPQNENLEDDQKEEKLFKH